MKTMPCPPLLIALLANIPAVVSATTFSWITAGNGQWDTGTNWTGGTMPGNQAGDTTLFNAADVNASENIYINATTRDIPGSMVIGNTGTTSILGGTPATPATNTLTGINNITVNAGAGTVTFGTSGAAVNLSMDAATTTGYLNNSGNLLTFNGTISGSTSTSPLIFGGSGHTLLAGALSRGKDVTKHGTGTVTITAAATLTSGSIAANGGILQLSNAGTLSNATTATMRRAGTLLLDNSGTTNAPNRLSDTLSISPDLGGGVFSFHGANDAASAETVGVLTPASGVLTIDSVPGADTGAVGSPSVALTFAALGARTTGATLVFSGAGLGNDGTNKIVFTTAPDLTCHLIGGHAILGNEFATYNEDGAGSPNTRGVQAVAAAGYTTTFGTANNVKLTDSGPPALGTAANSLNLQTTAEQTFTIATTLTTGAVLNSNSGGGTNSIAGGSLGNGPDELIITTNNNLNISSSLTGNGVLTKSGAGTLTLGGAGATRTSANVFINQGVLKITSPTALYDTSADLNGTITVGANATLEVAANTTWTTSGQIPALTLNDNGATLKVSGNSSLTIGNKNVVITSLANGDATSVNLTAAAAGDTIRLNAAMRNATGGTTAPLIHVNGLGTVIIASNASNSTAAGSALNGSYAWIIDGGGKLLVTSSGARPLGLSGNAVTVTSGILGLGNDATTNYIYIMNGGTLAGAGGGTRTIVDASTIQLAADSTMDLKDAAVAATANMNLKFGGEIRGAGALTVTASGTGTGILTLNGINTHTGDTTVAGGTLELKGSGSLATSPVITLNQGTILDVSALDGGWLMGSSQTLRGSGTVTGSIVAGTGTVSPGASTGSLTVSADADLTGSALAIEIDDTQTPKCGTLAVTGALNITGATLNLTVTGTPARDSYIIATYGSLTGKPFTAITGTGLPPGYEIDYTYNSNTAIAIRRSNAGGNTYADWLSTRQPAAGFDTDSDRDGIPNGVEHVLGTNPNAGSPGLNLVSATPTSVTFRHTLNPAMASDVTHSYQWSSDLVEWKASGQTNSGGSTATITPSNPVNDVVTVTITLTGGRANKLFGRLVATRH